MKKFWKFENVDESLWRDWKWQLKNRLDNNSDIKEFFPNIEKKGLDNFVSYIRKYHLAVTPYTLSLVQLDDNLNPLEDDSIWKQFRFFSPEESKKKYDFDGRTENWENPKELPTEILHHKYPHKAIIRLVNTCFAHCSYCYLSLRIINKKISKSKKENSETWERTLRYLKNNPRIHDILLSGG